MRLLTYCAANRNFLARTIFNSNQLFAYHLTSTAATKSLLTTNNCEKSSIIYNKNYFIVSRQQANNELIMLKHFYSTTTTAKPKDDEEKLLHDSDDEKKKKTANNDEQQQTNKRPSKFKQFYSQYGPLFIVIHLTTVVMWIYSFYLISKQGYDITQLLYVFEKLNIMSKERVDSIHQRIDNYKPESGWITGENIKHFATAYMVYKVIAPFRYAVSIAITRSVVNKLRAKGILKR